MKCVTRWLICLALLCFKAHLFNGEVLNGHPSARLTRSTDPTVSVSDYFDHEPLYPQLFTCFTEHQALVYGQCFDLAQKAMDKNRIVFIKSMSDCIAATKLTQDHFSVKATCEKKYLKHVYLAFSDCYFSRIGQTSIATEPVDLQSVKAATIAASNLKDDEKNAALADFDRCVAADYSAPYHPFSFQSENHPENLRQFFYNINEMLNFGPLQPPPIVVALNCMETVLLQNGCASTSEGFIAELTHEVRVKPFLNDKVFQCMHEDHLWIHEVCGRSTSFQMASVWTDDCLMQKVGAVSTSYFFTQFNKKEPSLLIEIILGRSNLCDEQKMAAKATFDTCMAQNVTSPYEIFSMDLHKIPGPVIYKAIVTVLNHVYRIGNEQPTLEMRAVDCAYTALLLNGCDQTTPDDAAMKAFQDLIEMDNIFAYFDHF